MGITDKAHGAMRLIRGQARGTANDAAAKEAEDAIVAAFEAEAGLRAVAEWQGQSWDCPEVHEPEGWEDIREDVCTGYVDDDESAQLVCDMEPEQCAECWSKYWVARGKERQTDGQ